MLKKVLLSLALLLVLVEVALRLLDARAGRDADFFLPQDVLGEGMYMEHPFLGFRLRPGWERTEGYRTRINALGMRGAEMAAEKPAGTYRILCLGGSTTFGTGASADDRTYPAQLERLLNQQGGGRYEVGNCGVPGYTSIDNLINLELRLVELAPDAILIYDAPNDARIVQAEGFEPDYSHMRRPLGKVEVGGLDAFLLRWWRGYAWLTRGTDPHEQFGALANFMFVPGFKELHVPSGERLVEEGLDAFERNLRHMILIARAHGCLPVLQTFALRQASWKSQVEDFDECIAAMNERIRALAAGEGVPLVEIAGELTGQAALFDDLMHLNDKGELRHAQLVLEAARAQGFFSP